MREHPEQQGGNHKGLGKGMSEEKSKRKSKKSLCPSDKCSKKKKSNPLLKIPAQPKAPFLREILCVLDLALCFYCGV